MSSEYAAGDTHSFSFATTDVSMTALMNAMHGDTVRWFVSSKGVEMSEHVSDSVTYYAHLPATGKGFGITYKCTGPVCIAFNPHHMYIILKSHQQGDVCKWEFDARTPRFLLITIDCQGMGQAIHQWKLPLQTVDTEWYDAEPMEIEYFLAFESSDLSAVIQTFANIDKSARAVQIRVGPESIEFRHCTMTIRSSIMFNTATQQGGPSIAEKQSGGTETPQEEGGGVMSVAVDNEIVKGGKVRSTGRIVEHTYDLWQLQQILKCFSISRGAVLMFVRKDCPLIMEIKVGTLGKLRVGVLFTMDEYDEAEFLVGASVLDY